MGKDLSKSQSDGFKIFTLIRAYMTHGHLKADLDPLRLQETYSDSVGEKYNPQIGEFHNLVDFRHYGFSDLDLERTFHVGMPGMAGLVTK